MIAPDAHHSPDDPHMIAILQMTSGIDPMANADVIIAAIHDAAAAGAQMLFAPEMSLLLDRDRSRAARQMAAADAARDRVAMAAKQAGLWVHLGSVPVPSADAGRRHNRSHIINADGIIAAQYDKMHLFDVDLSTGERWRESDAMAPGTHPVVVATPLGLMGLTICYDLRFPALFAAYGDVPCDVIAVPAAFTVPTGQAHWHVLLRARAIENACYIVAAAQTGQHDDGRATYGHSLVVDPWGEMLLDAGDAPGISFVRLDPARLAAARGAIPVRTHRRPIGPPHHAP